jgi:uncharacterized membrane protein YqjE
MEQANVDFAETAAASKRFVRRLFSIGENRLELLLVEVQEERERLMRAIFLAAGVAVFGFLAGMALTAAIVVLLWNFSPAGILLALTSIYAITAFCLYRRITLLLRNWKTLSATLDQFKKDRACLEQNL